jgi:hypothetical protein
MWGGFLSAIRRDRRNLFFVGVCQHSGLGVADEP